MTDNFEKDINVPSKEIIIDGVDVSGCLSFDKNNGYNICCYDDTREDKIPFANFCQENPNCPYKNWKRKEQECKRLEKRISNYKCPMDNNADYCGYLEDYGELLGQLDQLKQALQEIKEIAENREIFCENCWGGVESFTCDDCGYVKILQKISECEVKDE